MKFFIYALFLAIPSMIFLAFLKVSGIIAWSWWWIASPVLLVWGLAIACVFFWLVVAVLFASSFEKEF